jgi:hypothetical protein
MAALDLTTIKACRTCRQGKSPSEFGRESRRPDGLRTQCKRCEAEYLRQYRKTDGYRRCQARFRSSDHHRNYLKVAKRGNNLRYKYRITEEQYDLLLSEQGGACAICQSTNPGGRHRTHFMVDHDHGTGQVRGLLCQKCNAGLGALGDDIDGLMRAVAYLSRSS